MDKNKSIDGLTSRRSKTTATKSATMRPSTKTTKSTNSKTAKTARKSVTPRTTKKTARTTSTTKTTKRTSTTKRPTSKISQTTNTTNTPINSIQPSSENTNIIESIETTETTNLPTKPISSAEDFLTPVQAFNFDEQTGELKTAKEQPMTNEESQKPKKTKKPVSKKRKIITGIILIIVLLLIGAVIWFIIWGNDLLAKIGNGEGNLFSLLSETYEPLKTDANGRTNILAFGTSGYDMEGTEKEGVHDGAQLTDSIMIISLDQETGDIAMLSLPRDLKATPTCTATGKINEVYWCNNMEGDNEQAGAEALMAEVSDILGIDFQYYAHLNWGSLVSIVDTLGGITVTVDEDINDYYRFEEGKTYDLDGEKALWLARIRYGTAHGDFTRSASQQKILIGIKDRILDKGLSITDLLGLASTLGDNLRTNFSVDEMKTAAHLLTDLDINNMRQVSLIEPEQLVTTGSINGISYVLPTGGAGYYTQIQDYVAKMFSSDPRQYEDSTILVLNGTETPGLASTEQNTLEEEGYSNIDADDAPAGEYNEEYTLYSLTDDKPGTKKLLEEKYGTAHSAEELPQGINTAYGFIIIIGNSPSKSKE